MKIFIKALITGIRSKTTNDNYVESLFFHNDLRIAQKSMTFFILKRLPKFLYKREKIILRFLKKD